MGMWDSKKLGWDDDEYKAIRYKFFRNLSEDKKQKPE